MYYQIGQSIAVTCIESWQVFNGDYQILGYTQIDDINLMGISILSLFIERNEEELFNQLYNEGRMFYILKRIERLNFEYIDKDGINDLVKEYMGPRSDNSHTKQQMFKDIANQGYTKLEDYEDRPEDKVALNLLDVYFTGCGIMTDLLTPGLTTVYTNQQKQHKDLVRDKYNKKE